MNEHRCTSTYKSDVAGTIVQCRYYRDHGDDGSSWHFSHGGLMWSDANEHHEPSPPPEPQTPWKVIDKHGYGYIGTSTRSEAEALCPEGDRIMKLVDADAQVVEPVSFATLMALATCDGPASVVHVLRSVGIEHTWNGYG